MMTFFGSCLTTEHHQVELGVLMPKLQAGAVLRFVFALLNLVFIAVSCFGSGNGFLTIF
jgi:hypothetical protein